MKKGGSSIYILTNKNKTTLYIGVTSDLIAREKGEINSDHKPRMERFVGRH